MRPRPARRVAGAPEVRLAAARAVELDCALAQADGAGDRRGRRAGGRARSARRRRAARAGGRTRTGAGAAPRRAPTPRRRARRPRRGRSGRRPARQRRNGSSCASSSLAGNVCLRAKRSPSGAMASSHSAHSALAAVDRRAQRVADPHADPGRRVGEREVVDLVVAGPAVPAQGVRAAHRSVRARAYLERGGKLGVAPGRSRRRACGRARGAGARRSRAPAATPAASRSSPVISRRTWRRSSIQRRAFSPPASATASSGAPRAARATSACVRRRAQRRAGREARGGGDRVALARREAHVVEPAQQRAGVHARGRGGERDEVARGPPPGSSASAPRQAARVGVEAVGQQARVAGRGRRAARRAGRARAARGAARRRARSPLTVDGSASRGERARCAARRRTPAARRSGRRATGGWDRRRTSGRAAPAGRRPRGRRARPARRAASPSRSSAIALTVTSRRREVLVERRPARRRAARPGAA